MTESYCVYVRYRDRPSLRASGLSSFEEAEECLGQVLMRSDSPDIRYWCITQPYGALGLPGPYGFDEKVLDSGGPAGL